MHSFLLTEWYLFNDDVGKVVVFIAAESARVCMCKCITPFAYCPQQLSGILRLE